MKQLLREIMILEYLRMNYEEDIEEIELSMNETIETQYIDIKNEDPQELEGVIEQASNFKEGFNKLYERYPQAPTPTTIRVGLSELEEGYTNTFEEGAE